MGGCGEGEGWGKGEVGVGRKEGEEGRRKERKRTFNIVFSKKLKNSNVVPNSSVTVDPALANVLFESSTCSPR